MTMKFILTGVPGAGKSTICNRVAEKMSGVSIVNYGDMIFEVAKELYPKIICAREDTRKLPRKNYKEIQIEAAKKISLLEDNVIIDTHMSLKTPFGFYPGLIPETLHIIQPDGIILVEFNPRDVIARREKDRLAGKRTTRDMESEEEILLHQQVNRMYAISYSAMNQCYVKIIDLTWPQKYEFQHTDYAVDKIIEMLNFKL